MAREGNLERGGIDFSDKINPSERSPQNRLIAYEIVEARVIEGERKKINSGPKIKKKRGKSRC